MIFQHADYRAFLREELSERIRTNPRFSMRAFAKLIGVSPSIISEVISGKKKLSLSMSIKVAQKLKLEPNEKEYLQLLILLENESAEDQRRQIIDRIESFQTKSETHDLSIEIFKVISEWYHAAILESLDLHATLSVEELGRRLGISKFQVDSVLERLEKLELIEKDSVGRWHKTNTNILTQSKIPNRALQYFHRQMLEKAIDSLEAQTPKEKIIGSETIAIEQAQLEEANKIIEDCFQKILKLSQKSKEKDAVYHLGIQFFKILSNKRGFL